MTKGGSGSAIADAARSRQSAQALYSALSSFQPELVGDDDSGYRVTVPLEGSDRQIIEILDVIEQYVTERDAGPALVELEGRHYTMHPAVGGVH